VSIALDQRPRLFLRRRLTEEEYDLRPSAWRQRHDRCRHAQGSIPAPTAPDSGCPAAKRRRIVESSVATEKLRPIRRERRLSSRQVGEGDMVCESRFSRIARQHRAGHRIDLRHDVGGGGTPREAEHPLDVCGHRETACLARAILDDEARDLDRIVEWNDLQQIERDAV